MVVSTDWSSVGYGVVDHCIWSDISHGVTLSDFPDFLDLELKQTED